AVLAKASGLVFGLVCLLAIELERRFTLACAGPSHLVELKALWRAIQRGPAAAPARLRRDLLHIVGGGLGLVFVYCGSDWQPQASALAWARQLPPGFAGKAAVTLIENLCFFSNAGEGLMRQVMHNIRGHGVFLLGQTDDRALWFYFPVVLTIKLSVPLLLLP